MKASVASKDAMKTAARFNNYFYLIIVLNSVWIEKYAAFARDRKKPARPQEPGLSFIIGCFMFLMHHANRPEHKVVAERKWRCARW